MDLNIFVIGVVLVFVLMAVGLVISDKNILWAIVPAMGGVIGIYFTLAVFGDGQITCSGCSAPLASAAGGSLDWQFLQFIPLVFTIVSFMVALYKAYKAL